MGTAYKIRCKHCGMQIERTAHSLRGTVPAHAARNEYVETQTAIRCPGCLRRLNGSQKEFAEQVEVTYIWD